ncbi:AAA family ATPase [Terrimonas pollutisoli]|uniref:AAA family ATPase n=1 Tax=Terrimonas pollutisoli TaxID=3034147 RepID=UPI0023EB7AAA|nr:NACHT domain-containing protein [Terrimonas sp. H1YJ31]
MAIQNPFPLTAYYGPEYFCNRQAETKRLTDNALNGVHTTLLSIRRMGKTGLIHHLFHKLAKRKDTYCLYADIYASQSQKDLIGQLSTAILKAFPSKKNAGKKVMDFITSLRPVISYDNLTGQPEVSFQFSQAKQQEQSLENLLQFLDSLDVLIIIAIDEFQQISQYPEKNTEALLRTLIQPLKNTRFIFSGSSRHVLTQMFTSNKRPFFGSAQLLELKSIRQGDYEAFIVQKFADHRRRIDADALHFICEWTRLHTYYTQVVCNRLFTEGHSGITLQIVQTACSELLNEQEANFFQYRSLLTPTQWQVLTAIAKEDKLYQPNARQFISQYRLGTPSNVKRSLEALMTKEMIYQEPEATGSFYRVYDCFLARWLQRM